MLWLGRAVKRAARASACTTFLLLVAAHVACGAPLVSAAAMLADGHPLATIATPPTDEGAPSEAQPLFSVGSPVGPLTYTPGGGVTVGDTGFNLGGYTSASITRDEGGEARGAIDDLSFLIGWRPVARLYFFTELEINNLVTIDDERRGGPGDSDFTAERLYGDVAITDSLNVRVGKFLTPVGRWNVIHAQPLVWTTSRPLVTELPFDTHTSGAMLFGNVFPTSDALGYQLYGQFTDQFDRIETPTHAARSGGGRLEYSVGDRWSIGASYLAFTPPQGDAWNHLTGLDGIWRSGPFEIMGEFAHVQPTSGAGRQWGLYLQAVEQVLPRAYLVQRYEHEDQPQHEPAVNLFVLGLALKPWPSVVLKGEYLFADHRAAASPPGVKASIAVLF